MSGYWNDSEGLYKDVPAIIFGDHTRILKFANTPFFLGADGVKLLKTRKKDLNYLFLLYELRVANIPNTGYNRHFKLLKDLTLSIPPLEMQEQFATFVQQSDKSKYHTSKTTMLNTEIETIVKEGFFLARKEKTFAAYLEDQNYDSMFKRFKLISQGNGQAGTEIGEKFTLSPKSCSPTDCLNSRNSGSYQG